MSFTTGSPVLAHSLLKQMPFLKKNTVAGSTGYFFQGSIPIGWYTNKKENQIFLIYEEIQSGAVAKSYMRKAFLIYEEMRKYFPIYEEAVSHIY